MPFDFQPLSLSGVIVVTPRHFRDDRGWFAERYRQTDFAAAGITESFVQDNVSYSSRGVLRGLHFQDAPAAQAKLVTALSGEIFDVAVDIRRDSQTYLRWIGVRLDATSGTALFIPKGFAHGFVVTSAEALVMYKCSAEYCPDCEGGIAWNDPTIGIEWPVDKPIVSEKDLCLKPISEQPHQVTP